MEVNMISYQSIINVAGPYQDVLAVLDQAHFIQDFRRIKEEYKEAVHRFLDAGGSIGDLKGKTAVSLNHAGKDRIEVKYKRFAKKHEVKNIIPGDLEAVTANVVAKSQVLANIYNKLGSAVFMLTVTDLKSMTSWESGTYTYHDFREAKGKFMKALKKMSSVELPSVQETLRHAEMSDKTVNKVATIMKKKAKKELALAHNA